MVTRGAHVGRRCSRLLESVVSIFPMCDCQPGGTPAPSPQPQSSMEVKPKAAGRDGFPRHRDGVRVRSNIAVSVGNGICCRITTRCLGVCSSCLLILFFFYLRAIRKTTQSSCATRVYAIRVKRISSPIPGAPCAEALRALCSTSWHHCLLEPPAAMQYAFHLAHCNATAMRQPLPAEYRALCASAGGRSAGRETGRTSLTGHE